jgi:hypothetical protein
MTLDYDTLGVKLQGDTPRRYGRLAHEAPSSARKSTGGPTGSCFTVGSITLVPGRREGPIELRTHRAENAAISARDRGLEWSSLGSARAGRVSATGRPAPRSGDPSPQPGRRPPRAMFAALTSWIAARRGLRVDCRDRASGGPGSRRGRSPVEPGGARAPSGDQPLGVAGTEPASCIFPATEIMEPKRVFPAKRAVLRVALLSL